MQLDVTKDAEIAKVFESITTSHGKLNVFVINAGIERMPKNNSLPALRAAYTQMFEVSATSVACICAAFQPLLTKSAEPKVINITSGLGSIANCLLKKKFCSPPYGTSKVAVNGLTAHLQTVENDRLALEKDQGGFTVRPARSYYSVAPDFLKTALTRFDEWEKYPCVGAEVVVQLIANGQYFDGTQWGFQEGNM